MSKKKDTNAITRDAQTKNPPVWGSAEYLKTTFDDITSASKCGKDSDAFSAIDARVRAIRTLKNEAHTYEVFRTTCPWDNKAVHYVGHVVLGLNGPGRQVDYLEALKKLVKDGRLSIIDVHLDIADDIWDVIVIMRDPNESK